MKEVKENGKVYKLPDILNPFQKEMYIHLIDWKWKNISDKVGYYQYKGKQIPYDAILPKSEQKNYPIIYKPILTELLKLKEKYPFKLHEHFNHMASSQAANVNLFLPILLNNKVNDILKEIKNDFISLATEELYKGFRIEFWDGYFNEEKGLLGDHNARSGTDSDIAIAYYNKEKELCLWLIEHKLTEKEFTTCGGYKSNRRNKSKHICQKTFLEIIENKNLCYYHNIRKFKYWDITDTNKSFFINHDKYLKCPFYNGMNQLWRNQLLGLVLENTGIYKHVYLSVVKHPGNITLNDTIEQYIELIKNNPKFSVLTSDDIIKSLSEVNDKEINDWIKWYKELYMI